MSSEHRVEVVRVGPIMKHPDADTLSITTVLGGYPVILRTGEYQEGDLAVYVPIDSVVPENDPRWEFLAGHRRIRAKRLRGIFSMGLLTKIDQDLAALHGTEPWIEGQEVSAELGIVKYEPEMHLIGGENEADPGYLPVYTDIEGLRRHQNVLQPGEEVVLHEKIHGANARYLFEGGRLWVGSRTNIKKADPKSQWWAAAAHGDLEAKLAAVPGIAVYGEIYGQVQDLKYGVAPSQGARFVAFDALDIKTRRYLDYDDFVVLMNRLGIPRVPELFRGPWPDRADAEAAGGAESAAWQSMCALAEGTTILGGGANVREGFVARPVKERCEHMGRVILKLHGAGYLLRKGG